MSANSWLLIFLALLLLLFPVHAAAELPTTEPEETAEETVIDDLPEETEEPSEPESVEDQEDPTEQDPTEGTVAPAGPTVAPFDFVLLEESGVQTVERLDQVIQILTGMMFFLGVCAGILFFKVLSDRVRSV